MEKLTDGALDLLFREARSHNAWLNQAINDDTLHQLYDLAKWGPTSANAGPARFVFVRSQKAKERLRPALAPGNVTKTMTALLPSSLQETDSFAAAADRDRDLFPAANNSSSTLALSNPDIGPQSSPSARAASIKDAP